MRPKKINISITPEVPVSTAESGFSAMQNDPDPSVSLDTYKLDRLKHENEELKRIQTENRELHEIRKSHASRLFWITLIWIFSLWCVVIAQGAGKFYFKLGCLMKTPIEFAFKLSDSVIIALMTSSTATVLGLYGIAAYWIYGNNRKDIPKSKKSKKSQ